MVCSKSNCGYVVKCICNIGEPSVINCLVDTGAVNTVISYSDLINNPILEVKGESAFISITRDKIKLSSVVVPQFTVGSIDMGSQEVYIAPMGTIQSSILGLDILSKLTIHQDAYSNKLNIDKSPQVNPFAAAVSKMV